MLNASEIEARDLERRGFSPEQIGLMQTEFAGLGGKDTFRKGGELLDADRAQRERNDYDQKHMAPIRAAQEQELSDWQARQAEQQLQERVRVARERAAWDPASAKFVRDHELFQAGAAQGRSAAVNEMGRDFIAAKPKDMSDKDWRAVVDHKEGAKSVKGAFEAVRNAPRVTSRPQPRNLSDFAPGVMNELHYVSPEPVDYWPLGPGYR